MSHDEVRAVMGDPQRQTERRWVYMTRGFEGESKRTVVNFLEGRVATFKRWG